MKIAYIAGSKIPSREANSIHVMKMCQAFVQEGHEVILLIPKYRSESVYNNSIWDHYGIRSPFEIEYINTGCVQFQPTNYLQLAKNAIKRCRLENVALIYCRNIESAAFSSLKKIPTIFESHSPYHGSNLGLIYFQLMLAGKGFYRLVVITEALKNIILHHNRKRIDPKRIIVTPDGVDLERFSGFREKANIKSSNHFVAGYIGHLYRGRGLELIYNLAQIMPSVTFLIIGGKEKDIERHQRLIASRNLQNIRILGFISNSDLPEYYQKCDVLLMPYQRKVNTAGILETSKWASPMKMFEYMATGLPIVSSDLPVFREVLDESNAILCPPDDVEAWKAAIERVIENREFAEHIGIQARMDVEQYTWRNRVKMVLYEINI